MTLVLTFGLSACGGSQSEETTTTVPATEFPVEKFAEALLSGNGAVYDKFTSEVTNRRFIFDGKGSKVADFNSIEGSPYYYTNYDWIYGIKISHIDVEIAPGQDDIIMNLKKGDKISFEGRLDKIWTFSENVAQFDFTDVVINSVNDIAVK